MLGAAADVEDILQETWLRWVDVDQRKVLNKRAYLVRITTRLSLNWMRTNARCRESYVGPLLPEPLLTSPDVVDVELDAITTIRIEDGRVVGLHTVRNPNKLRRLETVTALTR